MRTETNTLIKMKFEHDQTDLLVQSMKDEQANLYIQMAQLDALLLRLEGKIGRLDDLIDFTLTIKASA
jgi:hypothetical protein